MQWQTGDDIAKVIQEAILSEKPHLHYPTSDGLKEMAASKFVDPTGDSVVQAIIAQNTWDKK